MRIALDARGDVIADQLVGDLALPPARERTVQVGANNSALTSQVASANVSNTSVTAQFGAGNHAVTVQK